MNPATRLGCTNGRIGDAIPMVSRWMQTTLHTDKHVGGFDNIRWFSHCHGSRQYDEPSAPTPLMFCARAYSVMR
ncbi:hypothetical protein Y032_0164g3516 [Ancylostoma ceylanicum]|uniref:Uncharacterized protein n=1 Tax=Ancylostoma ceylanicum TaxID=53326 RepID=A0A016SX27_9BILA|nr:hypothetical protein Y032_0164g3516 [Ancylostoma ceylanicum]